MKIKGHNGFEYDENGERFMADVIISKIFKNILSKFIDTNLTAQIGNIYKGTDISTEIYQPKYVNNMGTSKCKFHFYSDHASHFILSWHSPSAGEIEINSDFFASDVIFEIKDLNAQWIKKVMIEDAYLRRKTIITKYKFPITIKNASLDVLVIIHFNEDIIPNQAYFDELLGDAFAKFNNISDSKIHNISAKSIKKHSLDYSIDLGSAGEDGLNFIFEALSNEDDIIERVEIKGKS